MPPRQSTVKLIAGWQARVQCLKAAIDTALGVRRGNLRCSAVRDAVGGGGGKEGRNLEAGGERFNLGRSVWGVTCFQG